MSLCYSGVVNVLTQVQLWAYFVTQLPTVSSINVKVCCHSWLNLCYVILQQWQRCTGGSSSFSPIRQFKKQNKNVFSQASTAAIWLIRRKTKLRLKYLHNRWMKYHESLHWRWWSQRMNPTDFGDPLIFIQCHRQVKFSNNPVIIQYFSTNLSKGNINISSIGPYNKMLLLVVIIIKAISAVN